LKKNRGQKQRTWARNHKNYAEKRDSKRGRQHFTVRKPGNEKHKQKKLGSK